MRAHSEPARHVVEISPLHAENAARVPAVSRSRARLHKPKNIMQKTLFQDYRGYSVRPSAHRLPDGYFSADLLLERSSALAEKMQYRFYSLGYFDKEIEATNFSREWAEDWINSKG